MTRNTFETDDRNAHELDLISIGQFLVNANYQFSTVTPLTQSRVVQRSSFKIATDLRGIFGWSLPFAPDLLPEHVLGHMRRANVLALLPDGCCRSKVRYSTFGQMLFMHSAYPTVEADAVFFGPDTVRFVNALELFLAQRRRPVARCADIGCGAGPAGIAIARQHPNAEVQLLDINDAALSAARVNASVNDASNAVAMRSDVLAGVSGQFDLIVSNPPYLVDAAARAYRHGGGEFGEALSLRILREAIPRLSPGGSLLLYTGTAVVNGIDIFGTAARRVADQYDLGRTYREIDPDVFGEELDTPNYALADRIAAVLLTVTRREK